MNSVINQPCKHHGTISYKQWSESNLFFVQRECSKCRNIFLVIFEITNITKTQLVKTIHQIKIQNGDELSYKEKQLKYYKKWEKYPKEI